MMIHLVDQDTKETFKSFGDNEVQAAIAAARASGKIVNMELDDECKDCLIFIVRDQDIKEAMKAVATLAASIGEAISAATETILKPLAETIGELSQFGVGRPPVEIKREIKHTKNPMQLSKLYKELDAAYKTYGRRK